MKHLLPSRRCQLLGISFLSLFGVSPYHMFRHHWTFHVMTDRSVSRLSEPFSCFVFHSEPWRPLWPKKKQVVWSLIITLRSSLSHFLFFCLSSYALFAFLPHHSKEMPFLLSHTQSSHFLSQGSCWNGNTVGFLMLQTAILILASVFIN